MSFLSGPKQQAPSFTGLDIQTSTFTLPIPIAYGRNRFAPNVIWYADFAANKQKQPGGKGGGGSTGFTYSASLILGLCEGPVSGVPTVWISSSSNIVDDIESLGADGMTLFNGASGQTPWGYVTARYPAQALAYPSTAYVCAANYDLGTDAQVPNHDMEVVAILAGTGINGQSDADPAQVAADFLTNPTYGVGFPASAIDSVSWYSSGAATSTGDAAWQTYCRALGIDFSPVLNDQEQASDTMTRWAQLTNTAPVISGAVLKMVPFGDLPVSGNGYAYVPNVAPVYALTDRDYVRTDGEDPVLLTRSDQADAYNCWRIEYSDRTDSYNNVTIEAKDQNSIEVYGLRVASTVQGHEIVSAAVAQLACNLILQRAVGIRNTYTFKLSQEYFLLEPMDLVTLTDSGLGLNASAVRITEIEEDDNGIFTVTAEEFPAGTATAVAYPVQPLVNTPLNSAVVPASVNPPVIFEPSPALTGGAAQVWIGISGRASGVADPNWGGAQVYLSIDNISYALIGQVDAAARQGVLTASLASFAGSGEDTGDTLAVSTAESGATLAGGTLALAEAGQMLCYVDGEVLSFVTATLTGTNAYALSGLLRGQYGTAAAAHASGAAFLRLDNFVFTYDLPAAYVGVPLYLKFASVNIFGGAVQDLSICTAYSYTPAGTGFAIAAPATIALAASRVTQSDGTTLLTMTATWSASAGPLLGSYEVQWSANGGTTWGNDASFGAAALTATLSPALAATSYAARVRAISQNGAAVSAWATSSAVGSGTLVAAAPAAPTGLTVAAIPGGFQLNWDASSDPSILCYQVWVATGASQPFSSASQVGQVAAPATTASVTGYAAAALSVFLVAINAAGSSSPAG